MRPSAGAAASAQTEEAPQGFVAPAPVEDEADTQPAPEPEAVPEPEPEVEDDAAASAYYQNCDAARAAGVAPIYEGEPGYRPGLDRDKDGIACDR